MLWLPSASILSGKVVCEDLFRRTVRQHVLVRDVYRREQVAAVIHGSSRFAARQQHYPAQEQRQTQQAAGCR